MTLTALIVVVAVKISIFLNVLALGMSARAGEALYVIHRPRVLLRSLLAMNLIMPLFAAGLVAAFDLNPAVKVALIALAVSPVPPRLPKKQLEAGGSASYTIGLLVAASLLAIVLVPLTVALLARAFGLETGVAVATIASIVAGSVLAPLAIGLAIGRFAPHTARRLAKPLDVIAGILLLVGAVPILVGAWPLMVALIGNGTVLALAAFSAIGLAVGHWLGGPDPDARAVLALSTALRHPAVAIAVGSVVLVDPKPVMAAVLLYLLVSGLVVLPYIRRRTRPRAGVGGAPVDRPLMRGNARAG
jgi:bile acid:Na+ symporter, BASS family